MVLGMPMAIATGIPRIEWHEGMARSTLRSKAPAQAQ